jgi:DNA modification methylase
VGQAAKCRCSGFDADLVLERMARDHATNAGLASSDQTLPGAGVTNITNNQGRTNWTKPYQLFLGNALEIVKTLPLAHTVITSVPYFRKRQYGDSSAEIGRDTEPEAFLADLEAVFSGIRLHPRGSVWVNIGDTRAHGELLMIPERFAWKMKLAGWKLVDDVIWAKVVDKTDGSTEGQCMIEPAENRLNGNGYEHLYRFVKCDPSEAWTDTCAVRIPRLSVESPRYLPEECMTVHTAIEGRCLHNVWLLPVAGTRRNHYAQFPVALCERPIAMTCPMRICSTCGHLRSRNVEMEDYEDGKAGERRMGKYSFAEGDALRNQAGRMDAGRSYVPKKPVTRGWTDCGHKSWTPGIVLDPFMGSATTGEAALRMGRQFIGIDLYQKYADIAEERCAGVQEEIEATGQFPWELEN